MKQYLVKVKAHIPYPYEREYRVDGSSIATVANRAIKLFRKDKPRKQIDEIQVHAKVLGDVY